MTYHSYQDTVAFERQCQAVLRDEDEQIVMAEVGDTLEVARCSFDGQIDATVTYAGKDTQMEWTCPQCGAEYTEYPADDY